MPKRFSCASMVVFALLVLWELFELIGRQYEWNWMPGWFEHESSLDIAGDVVIGFLSYGVVLGLYICSTAG
jgi:uncharacterized membrane protein YjdF